MLELLYGYDQRRLTLFRLLNIISQTEKNKNNQPSENEIREAQNINNF